MNSKITNIIQNGKNFISKHSSDILIIAGVGSLVTSTILGIKATPKALKLLEESNNPKDPKDKIKITWKEYIPSLSFGLTGIVFIFYGTHINNKKTTALATAYAISEKTLLRYKDKVIETIGENKEKKIREEINQDEINKNPVKEAQVIVTSKGNTLMRDSISGRYFRSDLEQIRKTINELNRQMTHQNYISLNEYYASIGLSPVKDGDLVGWNIDDGLIELEYGACLTEDDEPCISIDYSRSPKSKYDRLS